MLKTSVRGWKLMMGLSLAAFFIYDHLNSTFLRKNQSVLMSESALIAHESRSRSKTEILDLLANITARFGGFENPFNSNHSGEPFPSYIFMNMKNNSEETRRFDHAFTKFLSHPLSPVGKKLYLHVAIAGGSMSVGHEVQPGQSFFGKFSRRLQAVLSPSKIYAKFYNIALGATNSQYYAETISEHLNLKMIDIIFLEFSINDMLCPGWIDELVRAIWRVNPAILIIYVDIMSPIAFFQINVLSTRVYKPYCGPISNVTKRPVSLPWHLDVAKCYQVPVISFTKFLQAKYPNISQWSSQDRQMERDVYAAEDGAHPNEKVHHFLSEAIAFYFHKSLMSLLERLKSQPSPNNSFNDKFAFHQSPLYRQTWIDATEAFLTVNYSWRKNDKLWASMVNASQSVVATNDIMQALKKDSKRQFVRNGQILEPTLTYFLLPGVQGAYVQFKFSEHLLQRKPSCDRYLPRLAVAYRMCNNCPPGELSIHAEFLLQDESVVELWYLMRMSSWGFNANHVQYLIPAASEKEFTAFTDFRCFKVSYNDGEAETSNLTMANFGADYSRFCKSSKRFSAIRSLSLRIEQKKAGYDFVLHGVVMSYDCCVF